MYCMWSLLYESCAGTMLRYYNDARTTTISTGDNALTPIAARSDRQPSHPNRYG